MYLKRFAIHPPNELRWSSCYESDKDTWIKRDIIQKKDRHGRLLDKPFTTRNWVKKLKNFEHVWYFCGGDGCSVGMTNDYLREMRRQIVKQKRLLKKLAT